MKEDEVHSDGQFGAGLSVRQKTRESASFHGGGNGKRRGGARLVIKQRKREHTQEFPTG